ncbi:MAG: ATP-binding cassette domain-containing protein [Ignavibacteriales bacterium]|nr:ATP-binding cassette domain-containing protein [Ignavibacteriales bacterium]
MSVQIAPVVLAAKELQVEYGEQIILNHASLSIHEGDRIGLVGRNGAGKSTFLKIISAVMEPDAGEVVKRRGLTVSYLSQDFTLDTRRTVYENILDGAVELKSLLEEYHSLPTDSVKHHQLEEAIHHKDGWNLERKIDALIKELKAPERDRTIPSLSGGEKRRTALCQALISQPDLLILDEPTNHLDTESIEWIENFLATYTGTCIFVTHDRYFLDRIANRIVELSSGEFYSHQGNYTDYLINKAQRQQVLEIEDRKRRLFLRKELDWVMRGPKARRTKSKSRLDAYYEMAAEPGVQAELDVDMIIPPAEKMGNKVLELIDLGLSIGGKDLCNMLNVAFTRGRKIGIVGNNGAGKTTFLRALLGEVPVKMGKIEVGESVIFNYIDQGRLLLNNEDTVLQAIGEGSEFITFGKEKMPVWTYLRRFLFTDDRINTKVGKLSGGEKSRLTLARILRVGGNFLLLDEPTNDLDLPTLRILEEALINFGGCVLVVSHDRYFLNRVCDGIIAFEGNGNTYYSEGDYDFYVEKRKARLSAGTDTAAKQKKEDTRVKPQVKKLSWKETKELETIETQITEAEAEIGRIENIFALPDFFEKHGHEAKQLHEQLEALKLDAQKLFDRWEELESKKE